MVMKDLCEKIKWEQTRTLETGQVVTTGCEGEIVKRVLLGQAMIHVLFSEIVDVENIALLGHALTWITGTELNKSKVLSDFEYNALYP